MDLKDIAYSISVSNEDFIKELRKIMAQNRISIQDLSGRSGIPESTLYKIMSDPGKDFRISTYRQMIKGMESLLEIYPESDIHLIAVITSKEALDSIERKMVFKDREITIKDYPAHTIEDEIIQGIQAERDGALGILCGPVAASTLGKVVRVPVMALRFESNTIIKGLEKLSMKF